MPMPSSNQYGFLRSPMFSSNPLRKIAKLVRWAVDPHQECALPRWSWAESEERKQATNGHGRANDGTIPTDQGDDDGIQHYMYFDPYYSEYTIRVPTLNILCRI